ncbi:amidohydrolase [Aedoeadaptatus coxii]|uniref:amidohydrolase n=1 Tax=Aedoeadaptatus coxii TaxID=755172 RepID=UPI00175B845C|nr:amidohydrolase [Peptoniphilus coxii]CAC9933547.1 amidohydrolase [Peptoniphilus coxii]
MIKYIKKQIDVSESEFLSIMKYLHEHPEESGYEFETSTFLKNYAKSLGLDIYDAEGTGFIAVLDTGRKGKTLVIRSDIDALPISEDNQNLKGTKRTVSKRKGVSHLCGHDAHMTMALWTMKIMSEMKEKLSGRLLFAFEEGEEIGKGILPMLEALKNLEPIDGIWGMHVASFVESGLLSLTEGPVMSGVFPIDLSVSGKGGHCSRPDLSRNPLFAAATIINALGSAWANRMDPDHPVSLGLTTIHGGDSWNAIPDEVKIGGSLRFFDLDSGYKAAKILEEVSVNAAKAQNCEATLFKSTIYTPLCNDAKFTQSIREYLHEDLGDKLVSGHKWYASEPFSRYGENYPAAFGFLGTRNEAGGFGAEAHNSCFEVDESILPFGTLINCLIAYQFLNFNSECEQKL